MSLLYQLAPGLSEYALGPVRWAEYYGVPVTVTSVYRSAADQRRLRDAYLAGDSRYPAAAPGDSAHQYGLAWDSTVPEQYQAWWDYVRQAYGWQVPSNDRIHAQVPSWRTFVV